LRARNRWLRFDPLLLSQTRVAILEVRPLLTALLSDIHGNLEALNACLGHARERGAERFGFLGDLVGYGADARGVVDVVARYAADACYTFCGHVHDQLLYFDNARGRMTEFRPFPGTAIPVRSHRRWVVIVGSVGQPRDRNPAAAYTLFDLAGQTLTFFRVPYDAMAAADKIRHCGLPSSLAYRVELGI